MTFENPVVIKKGGGAEMITINKADMSNMFYQLPAGTVLPEEVKLSLPATTNLSSAVRQNVSVGLKKLTLALSNACIVAYLATYNTDLEELHFPNGITTVANVIGFLGMSSLKATALKKVTGEINLTGYSSLSDFCNAPLLEEIHFKADSFTMNASFVNCGKLNADSLASIANALDSASAPKTLSLHADSKTICNNTLGTVSGGVFTIDPTGSVTLWDFITQTKGWTIS